MAEDLISSPGNPQRGPNSILGHSMVPRLVRRIADRKSSPDSDAGQTDTLKTDWLQSALGAAFE